MSTAVLRYPKKWMIFFHIWIVRTRDSYLHLYLLINWDNNFEIVLKFPDVGQKFGIYKVLVKSQQNSWSENIHKEPEHNAT